MRAASSVATSVAFACVVGIALSTVEVRAQIATGNLGVLRIGDGATPLSTSAHPVFVDEYTVAGVHVRTIPLPVAASGQNQPCTNSGTATSEGLLTLSADARFLVCAGYAAPPGRASVASTTSTSTPRVLARIGLNGSIDTSTALTDAFSGGSVRSAVTDDGARFWAAGASGGVRTALLGASTSTALHTSAPTNNRVVTIVGGQLYVSSASGGFHGVGLVGTGLPVTGGQSVSLLPGMPSGSGPSSYDYFFADRSTLYVADDRTNGNGGVQKWTASGSTWSRQYTLAPASNVGCRGLTGAVIGGVAILFATTTDNRVVRVTDVGPGSPFVVVVTSQPNMALRGIRLAIAPGRIQRLSHGCGATTITATGFPTIRGRVTVGIGNVTGVAVVGLGFTLQSLPFCGCTIGHEWWLSLPTPQLTFDIPANPTLLGARFGLQGAEAFGVGGCPSPLVTTTDTMVVTIR